MRLNRGIRTLKINISCDQATLWSLARYIISVATGPLIIVAIARRFTPELQGYYYTFNSIIAFQVLFELGFSTCITQIVSHEFAQLSWTKENVIEGDEIALDRLKAVANLALKWYTVGALALFILLGVAGEFIFSNRQIEITWRLQWWLLSGGTALAFLALPFTAILNGSGQIPWVSKATIIQNLVRACVLIALIFFGGSLYSPGLASISAALVLIALLVGRWSHLLRQICGNELSRAIDFNWYREIWPFQWRLAVSWISGCLVFSSFTPLLFVQSGAIEAGKFGITWSVLQAITGLSQVFITAKQPEFGVLLAKKQFSQLKRNWSRASIQSIAMIITLLLLGVVALEFMERYHVMRARFLGWGSVMPLMVGITFSQIIACVTALARADKKEPFVWLTLVGSMVIGFGNFIWVRQYGTGGLAWNYCVITVLSTMMVLSMLHNIRPFSMNPFDKTKITSEI